MRFVKKRQQYENSTQSLTYHPLKQEARSYGWWVFLRKIGNRLVFNDYSYSKSTSRHQNEVWHHLNITGNIDGLIVIEAPDGLQDLRSALSLYEDGIVKLREAINRKGSRKKTNEDRKLQISKLKENIETVRYLMELEKKPMWEIEADELIDEELAV
jgi:hypothetical protein